MEALAIEIDEKDLIDKVNNQLLFGKSFGLNPFDIKIRVFILGKTN